ncbi:MAG: Na+/H+ antiporter NhaC family protein [Deltaproteobacteria bacterium]|nr:Na+/H+ antiporter NhaC family protein [Deltaproteobacteria bacterium]
MLWTVIAAALACADPGSVASIEVGPDNRIGDLPVELTLEVKDEDGKGLPDFCGTASLSGFVNDAGEPVTEVGPFRGGRIEVDNLHLVGESATVTVGPAHARYAPSRVPGFASILPPLFAILIAVITRQALFALFGGVWMGGLFLHGYNPLKALLSSFDRYLVDSIANHEHAAIVLFTLALGGIVGILSKCGATRALVDVIALRAKTRRSGLLTAWGAGLIVFFDDYANCLLVGNTVRPFTDRMRISREKLSFIVDSTAAPIATVAIISTWVGFQIGLFDDIFKDGSGYSLFISILPYSFYSFLTLAFVFLICFTGRDFGPMLRAERRALKTGELFRPGSKPLMDPELTEEFNKTEGAAPWWVAVVAVGSIVGIVMIGLYATGSAGAGEGAGLREIIAKADPYAVLLWASFGGSLIALILVLQGRYLDLEEATEAWVGGVKAMVMAVLVLVLAWSIGDVCKNDLLTGKWLLSNLSPSPVLLPSLTFLGAAVIALSTGSSFSTMAIMVPIAAPMAWSLTDDPSISAAAVETIRYGTLAAILSGSVFGDHCSPISDTTIMSSMSAASDHVDHVRTQLPYAVTVGGIAIATGFLPAGFGMSPWISLAIGLVLVFLVVRFVARPVDDGEDDDAAEAEPSDEELLTAN